MKWMKVTCAVLFCSMLLAGCGDASKTSEMLLPPNAKAFTRTRRQCLRSGLRTSAKGASVKSRGSSAGVLSGSVVSPVLNVSEMRRQATAPAKAPAPASWWPTARFRDAAGALSPKSACTALASMRSFWSVPVP